MILFLKLPSLKLFLRESSSKDINVSSEIFIKGVMGILVVSGRLYFFAWVIPYFIGSIMAVVSGFDPTSELSQRLGGISNLILIVYLLVFLRNTWKTTAFPLTVI